MGPGDQSGVEQTGGHEPLSADSGFVTWDCLKMEDLPQDKLSIQ